jgi:hypothetical protein
MGRRGLEAQNIERHAKCKRYLHVIMATPCRYQPGKTRKLTFLEA